MALSLHLGVIISFSPKKPLRQHASNTYYAIVSKPSDFSAPAAGLRYDGVVLDCMTTPSYLKPAA
jgi:hypothetical protein